MQDLSWSTAGEGMGWDGLLLPLLLLAWGAETFKKDNFPWESLRIPCFLSVQCHILGEWHRVPLGKDLTG